MIILLYGSDSYRSREKLNQIIDKYKQSDKTLSGLFVFDEEDFDLAKLNRVITEQSFFSDKKLIVIKNIFGAKEVSNLTEYLKGSKELFENKDTVIVFWQDDAIKKSDTLFKILTKKSNAAKKQEFKKLTDWELKKWIKDRLPESITLDGSALQTLTLYLGNDLWRLDNELKKLVNYKTKGSITVEDINLLVSGQIDLSIFQTIDALGQKNFSESLKKIKLFIAKGEDSMYLFSMAVYQFRNLIKAKSLLEDNISASEVSKKLKMHPYVAQKTLAQAKNFTFKELKDIYKNLLDLDKKIKTGKIESGLAIESIAFSFC